MRVTSSMYYKNIFTDSSKVNEKLFDVNRQISSGLKIQYGGDNATTFADTMRLDNELATLGQIKGSADIAFKMSNQADVVLGEFETSMDRTKTLLIQAATSAQSEASLDAIAKELRGLEKNFKNLANSSINGQYIFSGSAVDVKPISDDGIYNGNNISRNAFLGSRVEQQYNLPGSDLFLGEEALVKRQVTSNVPQYNLSAKYPDFLDTGSTLNGIDKIISTGDTIRDFMGSLDATTSATSHFYLSGTQSDGTAFKKHISMNDSGTVDELLAQIGNAYGNSAALNVVNVSLNSAGEIVVEDKMKGSSKLDFHMVGAVDYDQTDFYDAADINSGMYGIKAGNIDNLGDGETNFNQIINGTSSATDKKLYVKEFVKSSFAPAAGTTTNIDAILYDKTQFTKNGSKLSSSTPQIVSATNAFATPSTKISEVADLSQGTAGTLDGTQFTLSGTNTSGIAFTAQIDLRKIADGGSTFSLDGGVTNYDIFNMDTPRTAVDADKMTYQQLMDVTNMIVAGNIPSPTATHVNMTTNTLYTAAEEYDYALTSSSSYGSTFLSYDGKIQFKDPNSSDTKASLAMYDSNSGKFGNDASVITFNSNNAITVRDPKTDFFKSLDEIITAVEDHKLQPDSSNGNKRSVGIQNAISIIDDLMDHVGRAHAVVGAHSSTLTDALDRTQLLEMSTMTLRSSVIDTDIADASLQLTQLSLNLQAMLSTVGKVSKLSLVNYI